ncbi:class I SAM-dependent methyltransferase [Symmachiella dynata]|uniref:class I SAM-dependent methyltransferase n=1 Tax=Symmachiella dynata TaxID=2527995 RepID=UPI0030EE48AC
MNLYTKVTTHLRNGTLVDRLRSKISRIKNTKVRCRQLEAHGDVYHGQVAENYLTIRQEQDHWHLEQEVMRNLLAELPDGISVLDVPFGTGRFVPYYIDKQMDICGLDSSKDMLSIARRELKSDYDDCALRLGRAEQLPYTSNNFDLVVCFRFLSHVVSFRQATAALREINRVSRSRALLQFRVRRDDAPAVREPLPEEPIDNRLRVKELTTLLNEVGFQVDKISYLEEREAYVRCVFACKKETNHT